MAHQPQFSIIIPALNEARYLPHLLTDLSNQTFKDFEVIVVDGNSDDQTVAKAKSFKSTLPSLTILTSPKRHVCTQRNLGAKSAKASVLIFSDADNRLPPYFLQGIKYRWESERTDIISPYIKPDVLSPQNITISATINYFVDLQMSIKPHFLLESCVVINTKCFNTVGGFSESTNYGEGTVFMDKATSLGFKATAIKDPSYIFSFRRLKKFGTAKTVSNTLKLQLLDLFNLDQKKTNFSKLYPMLGGKVYDQKYRINKRRIPKFIKNIAKILKDF